MNPDIVRAVRTCQEFADYEATFIHRGASIRAMANALARQAKRLKATRLACGKMTQKEFYQAIGVPKSSWSEFESGNRHLTLEVARKIKDRFKIPLDWTLDGDIQALELAPRQIAEKIELLSA